MIKSRLTKVATGKGGKKFLELYYRDQWLSLTQLAKLPEFKGRGLTGAVLYTRYKVQKYKTAEKLFKKKNKYKKETKRRDAWLFEGCSPEQIAALKQGTNKALLEVE